MHFREALPRDLGNIVSIHVEGSQQAYASFLPPSYLSNVMPKEKGELWRARLGDGLDKSKLSVTVAEQGKDLAGFACFQLDQETDHGTYLHNIFVDNGYQRQGVARGLLISGIATFKMNRLEEPVHLLVFAENTPARAFYQRLGGTVIEQIERDQGGSVPLVLCRYQWTSANALRENALR